MTRREYAKYCGPGTVAAVLGVSKRLAARLLLLSWQGRRPDDGGTWTREITTVLRRYGRVAPGSSFRAQGRRVSVARWLREHPRTEACLATRDHVLYVRDGEVAFDTVEGGSRRKKVTEVLTLRRAK